MRIRIPSRGQSLFALHCLLLLTTAFSTFSQEASRGLAPNDLPGLQYTNAFFPDATYRDSIPQVESLVGFPAGQRAAAPAQIERCLKAWAEAAPARTRLVEYGRTHENRPLHYLVVSSPRNIERLDQIKEGMAKLSDPRATGDAEARRLIESLPAVAWLAYSIHGNETEGSDAALAVLYHLLASEESEIEKLLEDLVVVVDPLMNPDGRERFLKMIAEHRGTMPNVDDLSLIHEGYWPSGRGNHYLFDMNRDWILATQPETRGRIRAASEWSPLLFVDAHGMGSQDTHLFSPPREPLNHNFPSGRTNWASIFALDQAQAFDRHGYLYYTGEWAEEWYPGYSDSWTSYRGAIGVLYEQASVAEDGARRPSGQILSYRESVFHHVIGSLANLRTLRANRQKLLEYFWNARREAVDPNGRYGNRTFAILPTKNHSRLRDLLDALRIQGFEVFTTKKSFTAAVAVDHLGREEKNRNIPPGTILIPNRQPLGHLLAAMLEFDPRLSESALLDERQEVLRTGGSRMYDNTAWNLTMAYGLPALTLSMHLPELAEPIGTPQPAGAPVDSALAVAWVFDGADDLSITAAARLLELGVEVRAAEKPFRFDDREFARGSILITRLDNRSLAGEAERLAWKIARELHLPIHVIQHGLAPGDGPDLGGSHFVRLETPRIAVLGRGGVSPADFGAIWHLLDHQLAIRHSHVTEDFGRDLGRYNVLVLPDRWVPGLAHSLTNGLLDWIRAGGTLISIGSANADLVQEKNGFSKVRALPDVLGKVAEYEIRLFREWQAGNTNLPAPDFLWSRRASPDLSYPWPPSDAAHPDEKELKKRDAWQSIFMPQGAILAARADQRHWLTFGCSEALSVLYASRGPVLMAGEGVESPIRLGLTLPGKSSESVEGKDGKKSAPRIGFSALPPGTELYLRLSGLLWPEAVHRLANTPYLTREPAGRGQVILFASPPAVRGFTRSTARVLANAMILGPGFGSHQPIRP